MLNRYQAQRSPIAHIAFRKSSRNAIVIGLPIENPKSKIQSLAVFFYSKHPVIELFLKHLILLFVNAPSLIERLDDF
jgi:hypothetical protein